MGCSDSLLCSAFDFLEEFPSGLSSSKEASLPWLVMLGMGVILVASASSNFKVFFSRSGKFADGGRITGNTGRRARFGFLNILSFGCFREIRGYPFQKSFYFVLVSSGKNFEVICI